MARRALPVVAIGIVGLLAACGSDAPGAPDGPSGAAPARRVPVTTAVTTTVGPPPTTQSPAARLAATVGRTFTVGETTTEYVDATRPTSASGAWPGAPTRTFPVDLWFPAGPDGTPDRADGPYPLILFSHGYAVTPDTYRELPARWAAAGYVVAAPTYPLLSGSPAGPDHVDYAQSFADARFVLTRLLADAAATPGSSGATVLSGMVDPQRVAAAGQSDGEAVAYGLGFLRCCRDPRVRSVVALAGILGNVNGPVERDNGVAVLHLTGTADDVQDAGTALAWDRANLGDRHWSIAVVGGGHLAPFRDPATPWFAGVVDRTVAFLDGTLKDRPDRLTVLDDPEGGRFARDS